MMTVVAFVKLIPNPPALVEIRKTWYAAQDCQSADGEKTGLHTRFLLLELGGNN